MKKYFLLKCFGGGNVCLAECFGEGMTLETAIPTLAVSSPVPLNEDGYAKVGEVSYIVGESFCG